ncbi:MAG TPA: Trk family potassium uptake protein [Ruminococcaceae bacterium]|jgi:trk system potassium uptake protein TrkH|nr:Trk family potassium uptake protein [Oscillospiraceae bacterium]
MFHNIRFKKHLTTFQSIFLGFFLIIIIGSLLLMLPISSVSGKVTPFNESLFTATSAVCVTGLVVQDTGSYWSTFGQAIILILIQIGGLGVITVAASFALLSGRKISLMQRSTMQEAIAAPKIGGIVRLTGFVLKATLIFELSGAVIMMPVLCKDYGVKGVWLAVFHSISAFCNAGFDILGTDASKYVSLTQYVNCTSINLAVIFLIVIGGIGFLTWEDIYTNKLHFRRYRMQSKVILITSAILIIVPALYFFFFDLNNLPIKQRILSSLFQSVTTRTAGFNTVDLTALQEPSIATMIVLMIIGGSPGSTAGGIKTTTVAVLIANSLATFGRKDSSHFFKRRIDNQVVKNASTILIMYLVLSFTGAVAISTAEKIPFLKCLFETSSAIGTVGLTLGITPELGLFSQLILILLMFCGRVGGLTLIYAAISNTKKNISKYPLERITVG